MSLIQNNVVSGLTDRVSYQANAYKSTFNTNKAGTPLYVRIHTGVSATTGDYDIENALIDGSNAADNNTISGSMFKNVWSQFVTDLESHVIDHNAVSFNSWLNISGINVHSDYADVYFQCKGSNLDGRNVFFPDANLLVATNTVVSSGANTYASVLPVGAGTGSWSSTNYAAAKMVLVPVQNIYSGTIVNLQLLAENLAGGTTTTSANISLPVTSTAILSGTQYPINSSAPYLDVTNIRSLGGAAADVYRVYALRERTIAL